MVLISSAPDRSRFPPFFEGKPFPAVLVHAADSRLLSSVFSRKGAGLFPPICAVRVGFVFFETFWPHPPFLPKHAFPSSSCFSRMLKRPGICLFYLFSATASVQMNKHFLFFRDFSVSPRRFLGSLCVSFFTPPLIWVSRSSSMPLIRQTFPPL